MKRLTLVFAAVLGLTAAVVATAGQAGPTDGREIVAPSPIRPAAIYMVTRSDDATVITAFSDPKDCERFAPGLKSECMSGGEVVKRYPQAASKT